MVSHALDWACAELGLLGGVPADRRGIEQDLRPLKGRQPGGFGIPLVPADQGPHAGERRVKRLETEVAGGEVVLLVVERVVGDVHLAITAAERAVGVEDDGRVVVNPRRAALEDRADHDHPRLSRDLGERLGGRARDRLGQVEARGVLDLAEILACGTARAGRRPGRRGPRPARSMAHARLKLSSGSVEHRIWIKPTVNGLGCLIHGVGLGLPMRRSDQSRRCSSYRVSQAGARLLRICRTRQP